MLLHELAKYRHQDYAALVSSSVVFTRRVMPPFGIIREGFPRSAQEPDTSSRRLHEAPPVLTSSMHFSTRLQRFAYARLLASYLTGSDPTFSSTLTTIALYDSSLRWFEARSRKLASRGPSLISCAAWLLWKCLTTWLISFAPSWRTFIEMPTSVGFKFGFHVGSWQ